MREQTALTRKTIQNCADATASSSTGLSITGTESWSVTKTNGITTTNGYTLNLNFNISGYGSGGVSRNVSQQVSTSTSVMEGGSKQVTRSSTETITIGPKKAIEIEFFAYQSGAEIPFSASVVIDGDLQPNANGIATASALLSDAERTIPVSGMLRISDMSQANIRTRDLGGAQGCNEDRISVVSEEHFPAFPAEALGSYFIEGFTTSAMMKRSHDKHFAHIDTSTAQNSSRDDGPVIGPADGTSYEVLYTTQVHEPTALCGFNDLGVMNLGIFNVESRQYRTYVNGTMINQWQESVKSFIACYG